ncbi:MAG TPA: peptide chain release factor N(5)-glutamine methyltransferase [Ktedonobacterales bacterium]|nr:peptide chain release factor N(5)-glutamine methyltransferase [Ktedonobacterales bacterium]
MADDAESSELPPPTWGAALAWAARALGELAALPGAPREAEVLLGHVTGAGRATVLAYPERSLTAAQRARLADLVRRRAAGEPVAYLTGHREFMGLDLLTDTRALIPRPETEHLVEAALASLRTRLERGERPVVVDVGTGSGAIAVALAAREPRQAMVFATDISAPALALAEANAQSLGVAERLVFLQGDLLAPLPDAPIDLLLANLPYIDPAEAPDLPPDVRDYEPALALFGAGDGLGHIARLLAEAAPRLAPGGECWLEIGYDQGKRAAALARARFPGAAVAVRQDYAGLDRLLYIRG